MIRLEMESLPEQAGHGRGVSDTRDASLTSRPGRNFPYLDERQRRLLMGAKAQALGHGGIRLVA